MQLFLRKSAQHLWELLCENGEPSMPHTCAAVHTACSVKQDCIKKQWCALVHCALHKKIVSPQT